MSLAADTQGRDLAAIIETPCEHVRFGDYLQRLQGYHLGAKRSAHSRREANHFGFIILRR
jgi:hypothetical protein